MTFNYRFSVIPAGAITDVRLTPRALQVLCLLGRHTNDAGWCSRSQVKMAKELNCGRTTIYDAITLLHECGWIERKSNGRGGREHIEGEPQFAAYSYRVILDRESLPERAKADDEPAGEAAGGAAQAAGGAAPEPAPLEGTLSNRIPSEPESERERARAREVRASGLAAFEARWPTAAQDDRNKTEYAWEALTDEEREAALSGIGPFLEDQKRQKRSHLPPGWKYLEQKRWNLLIEKAAAAKPTSTQVAVNSPEGRALITLHTIAGMRRPFELGGKFMLIRPMTPQLLVLADAPDQDKWIFIPADARNQCGAWNEFIADALHGKPRPELINDRNPHGKPGFMAPYDWPPRKDGTLCDTAA